LEKKRKVLTKGETKLRRRKLGLTRTESLGAQKNSLEQEKEARKQTKKGGRSKMMLREGGGEGEKKSKKKWDQGF